MRGSRRFKKQTGTIDLPLDSEAHSAQCGKDVRKEAPREVVMFQKSARRAVHRRLQHRIDPKEISNGKSFKPKRLSSDDERV